jgi:hypothetical protein|tara:strand:- start:62 stop:643 length:582 start_codon:yes stop_codon:yes gene_type:complete
MKIFISVIVLIFSLQSWTKADDISEFQIEGMSVGDSVLDYYTEKEIDTFQYTFYSNSTEYKAVAITDEKFNTYEYIQVEFLTDDKNYIIQSLSGNINMDINSCLEEKKNLVEAVLNNSPKSKMKEYNKVKHSSEYPKSFVYKTNFTFDNGDKIRIYCLDWSDKATKREKYTDHLTLEISKKEFLDWLVNVVYN